MTKSGLLIALLGAPCAMAASAHAGCDDRPGTPNTVTMTATSANSVHVTWRNTIAKGMNPSGSTSVDPTGEGFFDMYFRNGSTGQIGRDPPPGTGVQGVAYGTSSGYDFDRLAPNTRYCFALRARSASGPKGCVSQVTSEWACATTLASGSASVPQGSPNPVAAAPTIRVEGRPMNTLVVSGSDFKANSPLQIRVTDQSLRSIPFLNNEGVTIRSDGSGHLKQTFHGLCQSPGILFFSATDGRPNKADKTGFLWSNTGRATCT